MEKQWKRKLARDLLALGSPVFFILVIIRTTIGPYYTFLTQLILSLILVSIFSIIIKDSDIYLARGLILAVFLSLFYDKLAFAIFVTLAGLLMIYSSYYLKTPKQKIIKGLTIGTLSTLLTYYLTPLIISYFPNLL